MTSVAGSFLTAEWRHLVMLNFPIDPGLLARHAPAGTEVDTWNGTAFVSLVGFRFLSTRVKGVAIPFHRDFDEINLRFYVGRQGPEGWRRGVVFVREVVPRRAIALVARLVYGEKYVACKTRSEIREPSASGPGLALYIWRGPSGWLEIGATYEGEPALPQPGSEEEFITEHYWGYASRRGGRTTEYRVEHPQWRAWSARSTTLVGDFADFYGADFAAALAAQPSSAFVAEGSTVTVRQGVSLAPSAPEGI